MKGALCSSPPLKDEDFCLFHSQSEKGKANRLKGIENRNRNRKLKFDERGFYTKYGMCQVLISLKKKILRDPKINEKTRVSLIIRLDRAITKKQQELLEEEKSRYGKGYIPFAERLEMAQKENLEGKKIS